jgi:hypothetical protein
VPFSTITLLFQTFSTAVALKTTKQEMDESKRIQRWSLESGKDSLEAVRIFLLPARVRLFFSSTIQILLWFCVFRIFIVSISDMEGLEDLVSFANLFGDLDNNLSGNQ